MLESDLSTTSNKLIFEQELARFGPGQAVATPLEDALAYCSRWATSHYENFLVASLLLPRRYRQDFHNIYAYCRWSDNLADEIDDPQRSLELLDWWERELQQCRAGQPRHPILVALQQTLHSRSLTLAPFTDLLSAFRQDQGSVRYTDDQALLDYCRRSANPVGRILLELANSSNARTQPLSDQVCTGLQLANFCQDFAVDARRQRIYIPQSRWLAHGVDEAMILDCRPTGKMRGMLAVWVDTARGYLNQGWPLLAHVPRWLRTDIDLFVRGGHAILDAIEAHSFDVWTQRPKVTKRTQAKLYCKSLLGSILGLTSPRTPSTEGLKS